MNSIYNLIKKASEMLGKTIQYITVAIILFLLVLSCGQVILRTFNLPQMGVEEIMKFPTIWMYMLGGICASFTRTQIDCGIIESMIKSSNAKKILAVVKCIVSIIVSIFIIRWTNEYLAYCFSTNKLSTIYQIPWTLANIAILVGIVGMLIYIILELLETLISFTINKEAEQ